MYGVSLRTKPYVQAFLDADEQAGGTVADATPVTLSERLKTILRDCIGMWAVLVVGGLHCVHG